MLSSSTVYSSFFIKRRAISTGNLACAGSDRYQVRRRRRVGGCAASKSHVVCPRSRKPTKRLQKLPQPDGWCKQAGYLPCAPGLAPQPTSVGLSGSWPTVFIWQLHLSWVMGFISSAQGFWWAFKLLLRRREELLRARKRGFVVVITGGTGGIGFATVRAMCSRLSQIEARETHTVILTSRSYSKGLVS